MYFYNNFDVFDYLLGKAEANRNSSEEAIPN